MLGDVTFVSVAADRPVFVMTAVMLNTSPAATPLAHAVNPGARVIRVVATARSHVPGTTYDRGQMDSVGDCGQ